MSRLTAAISFAALALVCAGWAPVGWAASWDEEWYNPRPAEDDLVLPMPCGGNMVFRPVAIESTGPLADLRIEIGLADPNLGYAEDRRFEHVAGTFTDPGNPHRRIYYIGKYEVTSLQWDAFGAGCREGEVDDAQLLPAVNQSWFDAMAFGRTYTEWLMENARDRLPVEGQLPGFLRMPTEAEWEFAARGGSAVSQTDFVDRVFPMPDGEMSNYVWYQGSQSAAGKLHRVGLLEPNPLGIHDMLGNAAEMVLDPYRLNRRGRLHGQAGGLIAKGGDILTSRDQMRSSIRDEYPLFDTQTGKAARRRTLGFRLVLTAPVLVSEDRVAEIRAEWGQLPAGDAATAVTRQENQALAAIDSASRETQDRELQARLRAALTALEQASTERNEARDRAVKSLVQTGAIFGVKVRSDRVRLHTIEDALRSADRACGELERIARQAEASHDPAASQARQALKKAIEQRERIDANRREVLQQLESSMSFYTDLVITVATDHPPPVVQPQLEAVKVEFTTKRNGYLVPAADLFFRHMEDYRRSRRIDRERWLNEITP
jgi:Sulfatase-modifying factor enzyme 1